MGKNWSDYFASSFTPAFNNAQQYAYEKWKADQVVDAENTKNQIEMAKMGYSPSQITPTQFKKYGNAPTPPPGVIATGKPELRSQYIKMGNQMYRPNPGLIDNIGKMKNKDSKVVLNRLKPEDQIAAWQIARNVGGTRSAEKMVDTVASAMEQGLNRDEIEDRLRYSSQSSKFNNEVRNAAQTLSIKTSDSIRNSDFDALDDYVQQGDVSGTRDYLKRMAVKNSPQDLQSRVMGKERTVEFLGEIQNDLNELEKNGVPTGFFRGNYENILAKVGRINDPKMREVATKIATAMMSYRRDMTGVQFTEAESKEYKRIFPDINKVGEFNKANIDALNKTFTGDLDKFYSQSMGDSNYKKIFKNEEQKLKTSSGMGYRVE